MNRAKRVMLVAGESSGDGLAAELVRAMRSRFGADLEYFGAGGARMEEAGVQLSMDLTRHAVVGIWEPLGQLRKLRRLFNDLVDLAVLRRPDLVILVDYSGFNLRLSRAILSAALKKAPGWRPKLVYFISPQVWASRPQRAQKIEADFDLLLSIFPFEKAWYAQRAPKLNVCFVGHPLVDRFPGVDRSALARRLGPDRPLIAILPGSRRGEIRRLFPVMLQAAGLVAERTPGARFCAVASSAEAKEAMEQWIARTERRDLEIEVRLGGLQEVLSNADLALACSGTVTMELAWFATPSVVVYRTSWLTYQIAKRLIQTPFLAMPNIIAGKEIFPELIQSALRAQSLADRAVDLLNDPSARAAVFEALEDVVGRLGESGATTRAAVAIGEICPELSGS